MPIYEYVAVGQGCRYCKDGFEKIQTMSEDPLKTCPKCHGEIKKRPSRFSGGVDTLSDGNLRDKGFTKLKRRGDGTYEKTT